VRCAIHTRKSSGESLEHELNSLDAEHEACSAFLVSKDGKGRKRFPGRYDDGDIPAAHWNVLPSRA